MTKEEKKKILKQLTKMLKETAKYVVDRNDCSWRNILDEWGIDDDDNATYYEVGYCSALEDVIELLNQDEV